jgi:hypothetical protein
MAPPSFLEACLQEVERAVGIEENEEVQTSDNVEYVAHRQQGPLSVFQMQLPVACMLFLGNIACCSKGVLVRTLRPSFPPLRASRCHKRYQWAAVHQES